MRKTDSVTSQLFDNPELLPLGGSARAARRRVFVAAAFTPAITGERRQFDRHTRARIEAILSLLTAMDVPLFSSHQAEAWGAALETPSRLAERDIDQLQKTSHFIVYVGRVVSIGIFIELGYAISLGRPVLAIVDPEAGVRSDFFKGIVEVGLVKQVVWQSEQTLAPVIREFLDLPAN